jgi:hypothetical protein
MARAKNSAGSVTPSKSNNPELENIGVVVGQMSQSEELSKSNVEEINEKLGKNGLNDIVLGLNNIAAGIVTAADMLVAIAGYLYGEKGINQTTGFAQLTSKIKNTVPILGDEPIQDFLDMPSKPKDPAMLEVIITGLDDKSLDSLVELIQQLNSNFAMDGSKAIDNVVESLSLLSKVTEALNNVDLSAVNKTTYNKIILLSEICESIGIAPGFNTTLPNDSIENIAKVIPSISKIIESLSGLNFKGVKSIAGNIETLNDVVNTIANLELKKFNKSYLDNIDRMSESLNKLFGIPLFKGGFDKDVIKSIKDAESLFAELNAAVDSLLKIDLKPFNKTYLTKVEQFADAVWGILCTTDYVLQLVEISEEADFDEITDFTKDFNKDVIIPLANLDFSMITSDKVDSTKNFNDYVLTIITTAQILSKAIFFIEIVNDSIDSLNDYAKNLAEFISGKNGKGGLVMVMNRITKALDDGLDLKVINNFFTDLTTVTKTITKLGLLSILACITTPFIGMSINTLNKIIEKVNALDIKEINVGSKNIHELANFLTDMRNIFFAVTVCGVLALPALIGAFIMQFTASLIVKAVQSVMSSVTDLLADAKKVDSIKEFVKVILVIGGLMLIAALVGGLVMKYAANILGFAVILAAFIFLTCGTLALISKWIKPEVAESMDGLMRIIVACALVMMVGALFMLTGLWSEALLFGVVLAAFIFIVLIPFTIMSVFLDTAIKGAKEISQLIVTCTLVMLIGALFMMIPGLWWHSLLFGLMLAVFITLILAPIAIFAKVAGKKAMKSIDDIKKLVITCSIIMLIGALFMFIPGFGVNAMLFAILVAGFVNAIIVPFAFLSKKIKKAQSALYGLMAVIIASAFVLILGSLFIREYGWEDIAIFGVILVSFIGVIGGAAWVLGKIEKDLMKGLLAMACIVGIAAAFGLTLMLINKAMQEADPADLFIAVGVIAAIILVIGGLSVALGALSSIPPVSVFFWAGIGAMAAVAGIAVMFSYAIKNIAEAAKLMAEASKMGFEVEGAFAIVSGMIAVGQAVGAAGVLLPIALIRATSRSCLDMAYMIDMIGLAVARVSSLKVAESWDANGNPIKFVQLNKSHFDAAAENTKTIITTLGYAICQIYTDYPELFKVPEITEKTWWGGTRTVSGSKTIFQTVVEACSSMGNMLSLIGKGVADVASLKVVEDWDDEGKPKKYRHLTANDFKAAADNTKTIITTLGYAICGIYDEHKELFEVPMVTEKTWWGGTRKVSGKGPTVFEKVTNACASMGNMLSLIAKGVGDIASLQVADDWNDEGKPIHYRHLTEADFKTAADNTSLIVKTLGVALSTTYNENPDLFASEFTFVDGKLQGDTPAIRVINAGQQMGQMISSIAGGVQDIANLRLATKWDKDGNAIEWREMTSQDFTDAADKVGLIVSTLSLAINEVYEKNPDLFDPVTYMVKTEDGFFSDTYESRTEDAPMVKVLKAAGTLGDFVSGCAEAVMKVADLKFEDKNGKKINITIDDLKEGGKVSKNIAAVTTCLGQALNDAYYTADYKDTMFNPDWVVYTQLPAAVTLGKNLVEECLTLLETVEEKIGKSGVDKTMNKWTKTIKGFFEPFTDDSVINDTTIKRITEIGSANYDGIGQLSTHVNSLDTAKADKFIELSRELSNLSLSLGNLEDFAEAINGKITETLSELSAKLEFAAKVMQDAEDAQSKRQKLIDKNTKRLADIMKMPMTINLTKVTSKSSGGSKGSSGSGSTTPTVETTSSATQNYTLGQLLTVVRQIKTKVCGG